MGCGSVLNPGTVVGRQSNIYPLSLVRGYVPEKSIYKKQGEVVQKEEGQITMAGSMLGVIDGKGNGCNDRK